MSAGTAARPGASRSRPRARVTLHGAMVATALAGLAISGYLTSSSLAGSVPVCGGLGDCATIHASPYSELRGVPVSLLGLGSYLIIALLLFVQPWLREPAGYAALLGVLGVSVAGAVFSGYLTYMEFFVIRAVCPWCLGSAVSITAIAFLSAAQVDRECRRADGLISSGSR